MVGLTGGVRSVYNAPSLGNAGVSAGVRAVVDWFGPTDFSSIPGRHDRPETPFTYVEPGRTYPAFSIANGSVDCVVPVWQSQRLASALTKVGASVTLTVLPGARHEDPAFMRTQLTPTTAFLDRVLK
ncbi:prolyl oligopeptidase family serine peptidase [Cryptosporangium phraense]|uniref:Prolyl oligopeptidase family serine peptidase n=1 Tax=Cryptosporangium phraense TaxID=2593070 RepID=A0A545AFL7_9ACTN|nr:prolyl oligopeptidase family serine peptidase [Cryptosporangium phraense]TQS40128.1 prolyl oligopeptidase family serine peptidase [Cryptosporangium phraense]